MILFYRLLAWTSTFAPPRPAWLVLVGLLSVFLFLILGMVGIFVRYDRIRSNTKNSKRSIL